MYKKYVLIDCEQSLSFPCPLEITEFFFGRARNLILELAIYPHSLLVSFPSLHNIF